MSVTVDARGLLCPLPVLRLRKTLLALPQGAVVRLLATDPAAVIDVPHFCQQSGNLLIASRALDHGVTEYSVARGPAAAESINPTGPEDPANPGE